MCAYTLASVVSVRIHMLGKSQDRFYSFRVRVYQSTDFFKRVQLVEAKLRWKSD